ncbi:type II/IV secretion system ATPase subunit [Thermoproteota archaeon]
MNSASEFIEQIAVKPLYIFKDFYPVNPPFGYSGIEVLDEKGKMSYVSIEPSLRSAESQIIDEIKEFIVSTPEVSLHILDNPVLLKEYLLEKIRSFFKKNEKLVNPIAEDKLLYFLFRDFIGYGKMDVLMKDPFIEDISCNGYGSPIYIWHAIYESMPTKIQYETKDELSKIITRLVYMTGQQISIAQPILEGTLPEGFRAHVTLDEVSKKGDTFTIRKYKSNPFTIVDLIKRNTLDAKIGAYLWTLTEYKRSMMVCGAVASGKTALLNSIGMFIKPEMKAVTIEEVRELRLHENWIPLTSRPSFQPGVKEITLYDLLKSSLRQRPDYIIIGEVRGEETYTLFQSMAVGHGGICSIHADNLNSVTKRLRTKPMNIPEMMLSLMNTLILIRRVRKGEDVERRVDEIAEIMPQKSEDELAKLVPRFKWDAHEDTFNYFEPRQNDNHILKQISEIYQIPLKQIYQEMEIKETILKWMNKIDVQDYKEVSKIVRDYYLKPEEVSNLAKMETMH